MKRAFIIIDAQEDFTRGALKNEDAIKALPVIRELVRYAEDHQALLFYTMDTHHENYLETQEGRKLPVTHCIKDTPGWQICPEVLPGKMPLIRCQKEQFGYPDWGYSILNEMEEIVLCGFCTDICVSANFQILKALFPEISMTVISDACAGVTPKLHEAALLVMESCQANVMTWAEYAARA